MHFETRFVQDVQKGHVKINVHTGEIKIVLLYIKNFAIGLRCGVEQQGNLGN